MSIEFQYKNYIDGRWIGAKDSRSYEIRNPADWRHVLHNYPLSSKDLLAQAIEGAASAQQSWTSFSRKKRLSTSGAARPFRKLCNTPGTNKSQSVFVLVADHRRLHKYAG
jgi:hypothetical protein